MYIIILNSAIWFNECVNKITFLLSFTRSILLTKMQKFWNKKGLHVPSKWLYSLIMIISEDCAYWLGCWLVFHSYYCSDFKLSNSSTEKKTTTKLFSNENGKKSHHFLRKNIAIILQRVKIFISSHLEMELWINLGVVWNRGTCIHLNRLLKGLHPFFLKKKNVYTWVLQSPLKPT